MVTVRPEVFEVKYWVHLLLIASMLQAYFFGLSSVLTFGTVVHALVIGVADIVAHTMLKLD